MPGIVYHTAVLVIIGGSGLACVSGVSHYNTVWQFENIKLIYPEKLEAGRYDEVSLSKKVASEN